MYKSIFIIFSCFLFLSACSPKIYQSAEVKYFAEKDGTVTVNAIGYGSNVEKAIVSAEQKVFDVLFFRGLPESSQKVPLVSSNETEEKARHQNYFDEFYNKGRYKTFIQISKQKSDFVKSANDKKSVKMEITVNLTALRRDLEKFNMIRKFGY